MAGAVLVFRAPMRSRRDDVDHGRAVERALDRGLCGIGPALSRAPGSLASALDAVERETDVRSARRLERFALVPDGSFVWTRDVDGLHHLGRLAGAWRYDDSADARSVDLVHVRPCRWHPEPVIESELPAAVRETFRRGGRNFQGIRDESVVPGTLESWERPGRPTMGPA